MTQHYQECTAIVLAEQDHGESDRIITCLSRERGRFTGIAKGAKRSKRRFVNKLEIFSLLAITYSQRNETALAFIHDAELIESHLALRSDITLYFAASIVRELLLMGTLDNQGDMHLFALLQWVLTALNNQHEVQTTLSIFIIRYLDLLGYCPGLTHCICCGRPLAPAMRYFFHPGQAGLFCEQCACSNDLNSAIHGQKNELSLGTLRLLNSARYEPLERLHRLRFSPQAQVQALQALYRFSRTLFQHDIQAWKIFRSMKRMQKKPIIYA